MTTTDSMQQAVDAAAVVVTGTATPSQAPAARTARAWLLLAGKGVLLLAALVPGNLAFLSGADAKADVADAKAEAAYAVLRERVVYLEGQITEARGDLAAVRDLLKVLVVQRNDLVVAVETAEAAQTSGRAGRDRGREVVLPRLGTAPPNIEALSDQANVADLLRTVDTAAEQRVLQARVAMPPPAPLPSLDEAVEGRAQAAE